MKGREAQWETGRGKKRQCGTRSGRERKRKTGKDKERQLIYIFIYSV